ncbi:hypothetical protein [Kordia jejudonensis]|uniref:hypothetical protein n=1 Tax=Kordia jejudonensis TaxID=1348245 RepID=UPI00062972DA|nr:hypothetical protein [Kordia jejudonensis]
MKKLVLLTVLSIFLISCSSDDDAAAEITLTGTWRMTSFEVENSYDFNGDGTASRDLISETNCYQNETILINANGTATATSTSYLDVTAELVVGTTDEFTYTLDCVNETDIFLLNWSSNGSSVTFQDEYGDIVNATFDLNNQFSFVIPQGFEIFSDGFSVVTEENVRVVYTRQ